MLTIVELMAVSSSGCTSLRTSRCIVVVHQVVRAGGLFAGIDDGVERVGDVHDVDGGEDGCDGGGETVDQAAVAWARARR